MLQSKLFSGNQRLAACETQDQAHVTQGSQGDFVGLIQIALIEIDNASIEAGELASQFYGRTTSAAVLSYKKKRSIINRTYQSAADDIVGKMTIRSLDDELLKIAVGLPTDINAKELRPLIGRNF